MSSSRKKPPKIAEYILNKVSMPGQEFSLTGDFEEMFNEIALEKGMVSAVRWYWIQTIISIMPSIKTIIVWRYLMIKNYIKIGLRIIQRQKAFSFINIFGLTLGLIATFLIMLWVQDELSYDRYHENTDRLYRIYVKQPFKDGRVSYHSATPPPLAAALKRDFPEIENTARYSETIGSVLKYKDKKFESIKLANADPSLFTMFTFNFLKGSPETALSDPKSIVLTESTARKIFGDEDPINKVLDRSGFENLTVTAVISDIGDNTHIKFDCLAKADFKDHSTNWYMSYLPTYVMLGINAEKKAVEDKIFDYYKKHVQGTNIEIYLQPVKDIHLYTLEGNSGSIQYVYIFSLIAAFVLIMACINFMNLTTARAANRAVEVGIRKTVGAYRKNLVYQFYGETIVMISAAFIFALILMPIFIPFFNNVSGKNLSAGMLFDIYNLPLLLIVVSLTALVSGSYPSFVMSAFNEVSVLKGNFKIGGKSSLLRKGLVIKQFAISIVLLIFMMFALKQVRYINDTKLGYDGQNVLGFMVMYNELKDKLVTLKDELSKNPDIINVSLGTHYPNGIGNSIRITRWDGKTDNDGIHSYFSFADNDWFKVFNIPMLEGRGFSEGETSDEYEEIIINEQAVKVMGIESPIGKEISLGRKPGRIVGVVKDFHFMSIHEKIEPLIIRHDIKKFYNMYVQYSNDRVEPVISFIKEKYAELGSRFGLTYDFFDENYDTMYRTEQRIEAVVKSFTYLAIIISCLGLLGLSAFMAQQRKKEIGIRKVLGASLFKITGIITKEFLILVGISNLIAWPIAFFIVKKWLENFAYHTDLGPGIFLFASVIAIFTAFLTVGYQALKAGKTDPVDSLRNE